MIYPRTTKDYLEDSAVELFAASPIDKVTISDICENCGLSVRTYYNYFKDKYDIINRCYFDRFQTYVERNKGRIQFHDLMLYLSKEVCLNPEFFRHVFEYKGQNNIRMSMAKPLQSLFIIVIEADHHVTLNQKEQDAILFFLYGILAYVEVSLNRPSLFAPEVYTAFCENAIPEILSKYL